MVHTFDTDAIAIDLPLLAALVSGACDALEVPLADIGTAVNPVGAARYLVIFDTVPAGAGIAMKVGERSIEVMDHARQPTSVCSCGEETSCYSCLRHYGNQRVHDRLARRGATSVI